LEATNTTYIEPVQKGGYDQMTPYLSRSATPASPRETAFAPPILVHKGNVIAQTAAILGYLDATLGPIDLELEGGAGREVKASNAAAAWAKNAAMLTIMDCVAEVHNTHHPIDTTIYYDDQKPEAAKYAAAFRRNRLPTYVAHFERLLRDDGWLFDSGPTYVDLALWVLITGVSICLAAVGPLRRMGLTTLALFVQLKFAFPNSLDKTKASSPKLIHHFELVQSSPRIQACQSKLASLTSTSISLTLLTQHRPLERPPS